MLEIKAERLSFVLDIIKVSQIRYPATTLSKALDFDRGYVSSILNNKKPITDGFLMRLVATYGLPSHREEFLNYLSTLDANNKKLNTDNVQYAVSLRKRHELLQNQLSAQQTELNDLKLEVNKLKEILATLTPEGKSYLKK